MKIVKQKIEAVKATLDCVALHILGGNRSNDNDIVDKIRESKGALDDVVADATRALSSVKRPSSEGVVDTEVERHRASAADAGHSKEFDYHLSMFKDDWLPFGVWVLKTKHLNRLLDRTPVDSDDPIYKTINKLTRELGV